jgi:hypothetical protein
MTHEGCEPARDEAADPREDSAQASPAQAADLLGDVRKLRREARSARHAYWFPLVLFGLLTVAAMPFYVQPTMRSGFLIFKSGEPIMPLLGGGSFVSRVSLQYYWLAALLVGLALTLAWYRYHARRVGLRTAPRAYLITLVVLLVVAAVLPLLALIGPFHQLQWFLPGDLTIRGTFPFLIIAAGLWALAWAERSRALAVIALIYTGASLLASLYDVENVIFRGGWISGMDQYRFGSLPNVALPALVLLIAGLISFGIQRRQRRLA